MNIDDLLGKLMPLFEQKIAFTMEMGKRAMSLEEKKETSKTDLEYRKLEAQITTDKDKLKWEKEKLTTAVKADYDLQALKNSGMLDSERLKQIGEKDKQKIMEEGANSRAKLSADTETNKAYLSTLGTILGHAQEISQTGLDGQTKTSKPTAAVGDAARSLMEQTGLARPAATPRGRNVAGEAEVAADVLRQHEKAGTTDSARNYLNALPKDTQQATLALLRSGTSLATPTVDAAPVATPAAPPTVARPPISEAPAAAQSATPALESVRPAVEPATQVAPVPQQKRFATAGPLDSGGKTAFGGTPGGVLGEIWNRGSVKASKALEQRKMDEEEEKKRALRRARGLTVGGGF
jgi:hypothetical protein